MTPYQAGQRAALEKLAVFREWAAMRPGGLRAPHARGRGTDFASTAADVTKNLRKKYYRRAPNAVTGITGSINTVATNMPSAQVNKLTVGSPGPRAPDTSQGSWYRPHSKHIALNSNFSPTGVLGHEAGHAMPGDLSNRLQEEARATHNFVAAHGRDHADVPDLLRAFGSYVQGLDRLPFLPAQPPRFKALKDRLQTKSPYDHPDYIHAESAATKWRRSGAGRPQMEAALAADRAPLEAIRNKLTEQANALPYDARDAVRSRIKHYNHRLRALDNYHDNQMYARDSQITNLPRMSGLRLQNRAKGYLDRIDNAQKPETLQDYANLQGPARQQFEDWLTKTRGVIDSHFWEGAGNTALEPILAEIERLRR